MSMKLVKRVPTGDEIKELYPLSSELKAIKARRDEEIRKVFVGDDDRFIFIIGPCSADNEDAVCDYQTRLAKVADEVKDKILVIPRIYTNKPRTNQGQRVMDTKECSISQILQKHLICWKASMLYVKCT